jgi:hypothetical protein
MNLEARREPATIFCMSPPTHNRYPYSPIPARAIYDWPDGKRLAVYIGLNLEWFSFGQGLGAELAPGGPQPDVLNYAWRDYGNRVGVFRLAELFGELQLPVSLLINSEMYRHAPETVAAFTDAELVGHGRTNSERQGELSEYEERQLIEETTAADRAAFRKTSARLARTPGFRSPLYAGSPAGGRISLLARLVP